ncbi:MAG: hypothetical protein ABSC25_00845 [Roseiarcus sp.]|jgi:hypothetical protein
MSDDAIELAGRVRLNRLASQWGQEIRLERLFLARGVVAAFANGEFDALREPDPIVAVDPLTMEVTVLTKAAAAHGLEWFTTSRLHDVRNIDISIITGCLQVRPAAVAEFAKRRGFAPPSWWTDGEAGTKNKGGAPPAADWSAIQDSLEVEIDLVGFPRRDGSPGWRFKADVIRWVEKLTGDDEPGKTALKDNVSRMLDNIRQKKGQKVGK